MQTEKRSLWQKLYAFKVHHMLFWACYFFFWIFFYRNYYPSFGLLVFVVCIYFLFNASAFYTTAYYFFPKFLYRRRYGAFFIWLGVMLVTLSVGLGSCLYFVFKNALGEVAGRYGVQFPAMIQIGFISISTMAGLMGAIKLVTDKIKSDRTSRLIEQQRLESELQYLRAQVNPHFLFNAINSVYFLIKKNPDQAAETLIRLSDLLRFQLYDCSGDQISIEKEIEYLRNYVALEKIRKGAKVDVRFKQTGDLTGFRLAPLLLIPFVENAFKYVSNFNGQGENEISIHLKREGRLFTACIHNTTDNVIRNEVGGIGIKNARRRLELIYPEKHALEMREEAGTYSVTLTFTIV